jgi:predicted Zn-dependent protease
MQERFYELVDHVTGLLTGEEVLLAGFAGERSDFIRFNNARVRQAGNVVQRALALELVKGGRHVKASVTLSGNGEDASRAEAALRELRDQLPQVSEDPYLLYCPDGEGTAQVGADQLPRSDDALGAILREAAGKDMVGLYAAGGIFAGFANSLGQRNWSAAHSFMVDWSFYLAGDKAVKSNYSGFEWDQAQFERKFATAGAQLEMLSRPPKTIKPGNYRVYLAPAAFGEFVSMLSWGGFGVKAHRTKTSCLLKMTQGESLHELMSISENVAGGIAPNFQSAGFIKPPSVQLVQDGKLAQCLVSPRSAREYSLLTNGADDGESPSSLDIAGGDLKQDQILPLLNKGVYVNQLHYLNFSDRPACRITGMTRFATFWVEGGEIVAPLSVMRFDETAYRALGKNLLALTSARDFIPSTSTYGGRSTDSIRVPGALIDDFAFTL